VFKENLNPFIGASGALKIIKNGIELRKLWPLKVEGVKNSKKKPPNATKTSSHIPKKFLVCCFVTIKVQRVFVEFQVALL
jgi:hypothetical protein